MTRRMSRMKCGHSARPWCGLLSPDHFMLGLDSTLPAAEFGELWKNNKRTEKEFVVI